MHEQEGVIKYHLNHDDKPISAQISLKEISAWRCIMMRLGLLGQDNTRYEGFGFGNISQRISFPGDQFVISGTQTGHLHRLTRAHYAVVEKARPKSNQLVSHGNNKPSSEALTHAMVYKQSTDIHAVIHVHCPEIWKNTERLNLPHTADNIPYGTPAMAVAVDQLFNQGKLNQFRVFSMLGHEDGIIAFGRDLAQAANELILQLSKAFSLELDL